MRFLAIFALFVFITSCGNQTTNQKTEEVVVHESQGEVVSLENGIKWKANFDTNKGISNMKELMQSINSDSKLSDYRELGTNLREEFQHIFQRCDMTGEAHNQLHNYLHPMIDWFNKLKTGDLKQCHSTVIDLNKHLEAYDTYFK